MTWPIRGTMTSQAARLTEMYSCGLARNNRPQLLKQALQDEVGHLADLAGVLRHRNKQVGAGQGAVRSSPAQ